MKSWWKIFISLFLLTSNQRPYFTNHTKRQSRWHAQRFRQTFVFLYTTWNQRAVLSIARRWRKTQVPVNASLDVANNSRLQSVLCCCFGIKIKSIPMRRFWRKYSLCFFFGSDGNLVCRLRNTHVCIGLLKF